MGDSNVFVQALPQKIDLRFLLDALGGRNIFLVNSYKFTVQPNKKYNLRKLDNAIMCIAKPWGLSRPEDPW